MAQATVEKRPLRSPNLLSLPPELLLAVLSYLGTSSLISLKLSNRALFTRLPDPEPHWKDCASWCDQKASYRHLGERKMAAEGRRKCALCGQPDQAYRFASTAPICRSHDARFLSTAIPEYLEQALRGRLQDKAQQTDRPYWISFWRTLCLCRAVILDWNVPAVPPGGGGVSGTSYRHCCDCDACGHWPVRCYVRIARSVDYPYAAVLTRGAAHIREEHRLLEWSAPTQLRCDFYEAEAAAWMTEIASRRCKEASSKRMVTALVPVTALEDI